MSSKKNLTLIENFVTFETNQTINTVKLTQHILFYLNFLEFVMSKQSTPDQSANDFYSAWMERQNALVASWTNAAQQSTAAMMQGNVAEAMKHGAEAYTATMEHQTASAKQMMNPFGAWFAPQAAPNGASKPNDATTFPFMNLPFMNTQLTEANPMMQAWQNAFRQNPFGQNPIMQNPFVQNPFVQPWMQATSSAVPGFEQWSKFAEAGASSFAMMGQVAKMYEQWQHLSQSWSISVQKMYSSMADTMPAGVAQDTFRNMLSGANVYMKLFELWMPALELMKNGKPLKAEDIQSLMNPAQYKEVIDAVFEFMIPEQMQSLVKQMSAFTQSMNVSTNQAARILMGQMEQNASMIFGMMSHNPEAAVNVYNTLMSSYQQALSTISALPMNQRQSEMVAVGQEILSRLGEYSQAVIKFQHLLYTNGQKALEKMTEATFAAGRNKKAVSNFDEVFKTWVEMNEDVFHDLFETKEYAVMQSNLAKISSHLYNNFEHLFEIMLKDFPVVTRSHVDELAKTVFELKRKVRDLEKHDAYSEADAEPKNAKSNGKSTSTKAPAHKK